MELSFCTTWHVTWHVAQIKIKIKIIQTGIRIYCSMKPIIKQNSDRHRFSQIQTQSNVNFFFQQNHLRDNISLSWILTMQHKNWYQIHETNMPYQHTNISTQSKLNSNDVSTVQAYLQNTVHLNLKLSNSYRHHPVNCPFEWQCTQLYGLLIFVPCGQTSESLHKFG